MSNIVQTKANDKATLVDSGDKSGKGSSIEFLVKEVPEHIKRAYEQAQYNLRSHEPFLSCVLNRMRLGYSPDIRTAAVSIQRRGVVLYLSNWFAKLSPAERTALLKHEALHILHGHLPRSAAYVQMFGPKIRGLLNIAQDMAINPDIRPLLPPGSKLLPPSAKFQAKVAANQVNRANAAVTGGMASLANITNPAQALQAIQSVKQAADVTDDEIVGGQWPSMYNMPDGESFDWYLRKLMEEAGGSGGGGDGEDGDGELGKGKGKKGKSEQAGSDKGEGAEGIPPPPDTTLDKWEKWAKEKNPNPLDKHASDYDDEQPIEQPTGNEEFDEACRPLHEPESIARINEHILAEANKEYKDMCGQKGIGNMSGEYKELLDKILHPKPINWLSRFRNDLNQLRGGKKKATWKRKNRRGIPMAKGYKKGPRSRIALIIDTSGSMSAGELQLAMAETDNLSRKEEVYEIQCDTRVTSARRRRPGDAWAVFGRGGTDLVPGFELAKEEHYTAIICITDGGICRWPEKPKVPLIWVSTQQAATYPFGAVVRLTPQGSWWEPPIKIAK